MPIIADYHMHTHLCGHAQGQPEDYAQQALKKRLTEIGFSDHAPLVSHREPEITMDFDQLPQYWDMIQAVKKQFEGKLVVKAGIEADFLPGYEDKTRAILDQYPFDYVYGSVHYLGHWAFDHPNGMDVWNISEVDEVYRRYYEQLRQSALSGMFDILAHVDLVKKFGHRPSSDLTAEVRETADVFRETGVTIEINTSGLRKTAKEIYPSLDALKIYAQADIPIIFGSDAHRPQEVAWEFAQAADLAIQAGYRQYVLFKDRQIERLIPLV